MCKKCLKMRLLFAAGGFVVGALAGAGTVGLIAHRKIKEQDEVIRDLLDEINTPIDKKKKLVALDSDGNVVQEFYGSKNFPLDMGDLTEAQAEMRAVIAREGYGRIVPGQKPTLEELAQMENNAQDDLSPEEIEDGVDEEDDGQISIEDYENGEEGEEPHEITPEEFLEDHTFDKDQLTFYLEDETLCDSDDDILDIGSHLGYAPFMEAVQAIANRSRKATGLIYWRNPDISCDYEIELRDTSYTSTVLGVDDSERGGYKRSKRRRQEEEDE